MPAAIRSFPRALARLALAFAAALALAPIASRKPARAASTCGLKQPVPVETGKKIEVIEFFSYGCPHCADLEPHLQAWLKRLPADVQVRRVPVAFQPAWENLARVYYTLELMGEDAKLTPDVFSAIHGGNRPTSRATRGSSSGRPARGSTARRSRTPTSRSASPARSAARSRSRRRTTSSRCRR
jgi:thiol-disulfide isomerase/thioredoxin